MKTIPGGKTKVTYPNAKANEAMHEIHGGKGGPKSPTHGVDLSGDATNCIYKGIHPTNAESPNAKAHSKNQY
jgi:hypothetical protein